MNKHKESVRVFKAFCDEKRLAVLELLQEGVAQANKLIDKITAVNPRAKRKEWI